MLGLGLSLTRAALPLVKTAFSAAKYALAQNASDVNVLVIGDSTGNGSDEWVYLFGQWLAGQYPTHTVSYRLWDDVGNVYGTAAVLGVGTGSNTLRIWNASISGSRPSHVAGDKYVPAVSSVPTPALVLWNHGKNLTTQAPKSSVSRGDFLGPMEMVRQTFPSAAHAMIRQSPNRDDSSMDYVMPVVDGICSERTDTSSVDVYAAFMARGKDASLYVDNLHPSASGSALWASIVQAKWQRTAASSSFAALQAWLNTKASNLLANGNFLAWSSTVPDSWTLSGTGAAVAKNASITDGGSAYSTAVSGTGASCKITQLLSGSAVTALQGNKVTLAVRQNVPSGSAGSCGRIGVAYTGDADNSVSSVEGIGGWRWLIISGVQLPANNSFVRIDLYADTAANTSSVAYFDRAILIQGDIPRDML